MWDWLKLLSFCPGLNVILNDFTNTNSENSLLDTKRLTEIHFEVFH